MSAATTFIVIFQSEDWDTRIDAALADFDRERLALFGADDLARQGFASVDRSGQPQFFPLTTLSVGAVQVPVGARSSSRQVAARAGEAKAQAKKMTGNALFIDRRNWGPGLPGLAAPAAEADGG